jgi:hypothetical protein
MTSSNTEQTPPTGDNERRLVMHTFVRIISADKKSPAGKLADAELHFTGDDLDGLKLIGFAIWAGKGGNEPHVTFPARNYTIAGERRSYALLRPFEDVTAQDRLRDLLLRAYRAHAEAGPGENTGAASWQPQHQQARQRANEPSSSR